MTCHRMKYKFSHAGITPEGRKVYYWESGRLPGDSRVEQIKCDAEWFWHGGVPSAQGGQTSAEELSP